jgi:PAP2 superfamily
MSSTDNKLRFLVNVIHHPQLTIPSRTGSTGGETTTGLQSAESGRLPPWGQMEDMLLASITQAPIPIDWKPDDRTESTLEYWEKWLGGIVEGIASHLWPVYTPGSADWNSESVANLFDADFQLLAKLHQNLRLPIKAMFPTTVMHSDFFEQEDDGTIPFGAGYDRYDPTLSPDIIKGLPTILMAGMANKVGTLDLQLKHCFQRPRPYQVAVLQGRRGYSYRWAQTGNTPSLVSGHCLQSSLAGCTAFATLMQDQSARSIDVLRQFTVDIGDRRVFAGIHYPSDSLASWYTALNLVSCTFTEETVGPARKFLWEAINEKSDVFAAVKAHVHSNEASPYEKIVEEIRRLGSENA